MAIWSKRSAVSYVTCIKTVLTVVCNSCGDLFAAGELGPLAAPGAAHKKEGNDEQALAKDTEQPEIHEKNPTPASEGQRESGRTATLPTSMIVESGAITGQNLLKTASEAGPATQAGRADTAEAIPIPLTAPASDSIQQPQANDSASTVEAQMEVDSVPTATQPDPTF
jgi:hypothetical protein